MKIKYRGLTVDLNKLGKEVEESQDYLASVVEDAFENKLSKLIEDINEASTMRRRQLKEAGGYLNKGSVDQPLLKAKVISTFRGGKVRFYVNHKMTTDGKYNLFEILDKGIGRRFSEDKLMTFPIYEGNMTKKDSLEISSVELIKNDKGKPVFVRTDEIEGFEGRRFYRTIARDVLDELPSLIGKKTRRYPKGFQINGRKMGGKFAPNPARYIEIKVDNKKVK